MLSICTLNGRMVDEPRLNENGKTASVQFAIAIDRSWIGGKKSGCDFFKCVAFGRTAQFICSNFVEKDIVLVCAHSYDAYMRPLSTYTYETIRFLHIQGARKAQ